ncbi:unnamed protein product, partial [Mesorhabditis spiculigera]
MAWTELEGDKEELVAFAKTPALIALAKNSRDFIWLLKAARPQAAVNFRQNAPTTTEENKEKLDSGFEQRKQRVVGLNQAMKELGEEGMRIYEEDFMAMMTANEQLRAAKEIQRPGGTYSSFATESKCQIVRLEALLDSRQPGWRQTMEYQRTGSASQNEVCKTATTVAPGGNVNEECDRVADGLKVSLFDIECSRLEQLQYTYLLRHELAEDDKESAHLKALLRQSRHPGGSSASVRPSMFDEEDLQLGVVDGHLRITSISLVDPAVNESASEAHAVSTATAAPGGTKTQDNALQVVQPTWFQKLGHAIRYLACCRRGPDDDPRPLQRQAGGADGPAQNFAQLHVFPMLLTAARRQAALNFQQREPSTSEAYKEKLDTDWQQRLKRMQVFGESMRKMADNGASIYETELASLMECNEAIRTLHQTKFSEVSKLRAELDVEQPGWRQDGRFFQRSLFTTNSWRVQGVAHQLKPHCQRKVLEEISRPPPHSMQSLCHAPHYRPMRADETRDGLFERKAFILYFTRIYRAKYGWLEGRFEAKMQGGFKMAIPRRRTTGVDWVLSNDKECAILPNS